MQAWLIGAVVILLHGTGSGALAREELPSGQPTPTGKRVTPEAMQGALFQALNPNPPGLPDYTAEQAAAMALSPDRRTLLISTAGYNRVVGPDGKQVPALSSE